MRKYIFNSLTIISFILLLPIHNLYAQSNWCPPGSVWYYGFDAEYFSGYIKIEYVGDTLIQSFPCKKLQKTMYSYDFVSQELNSYIVGNEYTYADNDKVFYYRANHFFALFDFSAQPGDTWTVSGTKQYENCDSTGIVKVDSIGTIQIDGVQHRYICVSPAETSSEWGWRSVKIIENIGPVERFANNSYDFLFPVKLSYCGMALDEHIEGGSFRCYSNASGFDYASGIVAECDFIPTGAEEFHISDIVSILPNPFDRCTTIRFSKNYKNGNVHVFNMEGRLVKQLKLTELENSLDLSSYKSGIYMFVFLIDNQIQTLRSIKL
ncbi:hypothetical protein MASR2M12_21950 [Bacteroidales bacterium]